MRHEAGPTSGDAAITGAQSGVLLFYRIDTGLATTGRIDIDGNYADLRNHQFDKDWVRVFPVGNGFVIFSRRNGSSLLIGRVQPDGSYGDLKEFFNFPTPAGVVHVRDNIVLMHHPREMTIWRLGDGGDLLRLGIHRIDDWLFVASTHDGLVLFYNRANGNAATIRVESDGSVQNLQTHSGFDAWTHVISPTNRILLFYNEGTGAAATGRIDESGTYVDLATFSLDRGWRHVVPMIDGHVLFFSALTGASASGALGRVDANGMYTDGPAVNGRFDPWTFVGSVI